MKDGPFSQLSSFRKLLIFLFISLLSLLIFALVGLLLAQLITGIDSDNAILSNYENPTTILYLKIIQIAQSIGLFIVSPLLSVFLFRQKNENYLHLKNIHIIYMVLSGFLMLIALPFINGLAEINRSISFPDALSSIEQWMINSEKEAQNVTQYFLKAEHFSTLLFNLIMMAILPAIGEEFFFRGVLQKLITQMSRNSHLGIWITAFIFSAIHMQFLTFLPRFFMGIMFGYMLVWSGSIWLPISAHFVNNGTAVVLNYLIQKDTIGSEIDTIGNDNISLMSSSFILILSSLYFLKQRLAEKPKIPQTE